MKLSYDALVQAIWTYQLKTLSKHVLHRYVGGGHGVVDEGWFLNASGIHTCERGLITDKLGKQQMFKRVRELIEDKYVSWAHKPNTFFLDTKQAKAAFTAAREFWLSKGVPTGYHEEGGGSKFVVLENHPQMVDECFEHLKETFRSVDWIELSDIVYATK